MSASIGQGYDVVNVPLVSGADLGSGAMADAFVFLEYPDADAIRYLGVVGLTDPWFDRSHLMDAANTKDRSSIVILHPLHRLELKHNQGHVGP